MPILTDADLRDPSPPLPGEQRARRGRRTRPTSWGAAAG